MKPDLNSTELKWYEKKAGISQQQKNQAKEKKDIRKRRREEEKKGTDSSEKDSKPSFTKSEKKPEKTSVKFTHHEPRAVLLENSLFDNSKVPEDAQEIIRNFDKILLSTTPLSSRQRSLLPEQIRQLSHTLTDERSDRRVGYMNETTTLSAYIHYFLWWNLIRLTRLFANLDDSFFNLKDDEICLDIGSGPLTVPLALFLARPDLRKKQLTWYCMDISSQALNAGENLFLAVAAKLQCQPWKIMRIKGDLDTSIKDKAGLVTCANVFNEVVQDSSMPPDYLSKKYSEKLFSFTDKNAASRILIIEPGVPSAARFLRCIRDNFLRKEYRIVSPCPHMGECPMEGKKGHGAKWCNFAFSTEDAPAALKKLSSAADLPKERAVLSFIAAQKDSMISRLEEKVEEAEGKTSAATSLKFRIASDPIRLPGNRTGYYACSEKGLLLAVTSTPLHSGQCYSTKAPKGKLPVDQKSGASIITLD